MIYIGELRIGNVVLEHPGTERIISSITATGINWKNKYEGYWEIPVEELSGIPLTEEWLLRMGFEDWGCTDVSGFEKEHKFVHHNLVDGTSDLVITKRMSIYNAVYHEEWIIKIDDDVIPIHRLEFVHDAQNATYLLTGTELAIKS